MFSGLSVLPPDPVLGLSAEFKNDVRSEKVDLTIGVYCDENGHCPVFQAVREAESLLLRENILFNKQYLPICGTSAFNNAFQRLVLGSDLKADCVASTYALGGTSALRIGCALAAQSMHDSQSIWCSDPTWPNHIQIIEAVGKEAQQYSYVYDSAGFLDVEAMLNSLSEAKSGDVVILQACCHNPTGVDPTERQWFDIFEFMRERNLTPFFDVAYHGFGVAFDADLVFIQNAQRLFPYVLVAYSFSKTLGLYGERAGGLLVTCPTASEAKAVQTHIAKIVRSMYSNPARHGAMLVETILNTPSFSDLWKKEVARCSERINAMRNLFYDKLEGKPELANAFRNRYGFFSLLPLYMVNPAKLREDNAIYLLDSGRINVSSLNERNIQQVVNAVV